MGIVSVDGELLSNLLIVSLVYSLMGHKVKTQMAFFNSF